jgi:hypothetical protein
MDHRWDDGLRQEHARQAEQRRYGRGRIERDSAVERRDRLAASRRHTNRSPWEIGADHYDQRDLYTLNSHSEDDGYGVGPSYHPEEGSYAYHRDVLPPEPRRPPLHPGAEPTMYEREAWPWLNYYDRAQRNDAERGVWRAVRDEAGALMGRLGLRPHELRGPKGWWRADDAIREDVCEALAYDAILDARDIEVEVKDAEVWLRGTVADRAQKRRAEDLAERIPFVVDVHNRLSLRRDDDTAFASPVPA